MSSVHLTTWNILNVPLSLSLSFWCKKLWGLTSRCCWEHMSAEKPCQTQTLLARPFESLESCGSKIWIHSIYAGLDEFLPFVDWDFPETKKAWMRLESLFGGPELWPKPCNEGGRSSVLRSISKKALPWSSARWLVLEDVDRVPAEANLGTGAENSHLPTNEYCKWIAGA